MYIPPHFLETDLRRLDWLAAHDAFGTLVSTVDGAPFATHLPVLYRREDRKVTLLGHWARPNPQWHSIEGQRVLFIFHGPHAYISPRWYAEPARNVPTWDYATAHLYGRIQVIHEPEGLEEIVTALADQYERNAPAPWRMAQADGRARLRGIVGFRLAAESIEIKFKLNQNHVKENVTGAIAALAAQGREDASEIARLMQGALEARARPDEREGKG
ncbi:MAG TPA: FMN-binding negative transcriptional regulator [Steroidobacteraceae bacterium]|nr:FMN-binding negative transcriptional regulator [Steroidobacteraceae bacterium]